MNTVSSLITKVKSTLPAVTERGQIENTIRDTENILRDLALPTLTDVSTIFADGRTPKSTYGQSFVRGFVLALDIRQHKEWAKVAIDTLTVVDKHLQLLSKEINRNFLAKLVTEGLSVKQVNILSYVNVLYRYTNALSKVFYVIALAEADKVGGLKYNPSRSIDEVNNQALSTVVQYAPIIMKFRNERDLEKAIREVSDIDTDEETLERTISMDPKQLMIANGIFNGRYSILYGIRKWWIEHQFNNYETRKEERRAVQISMQQTLDDINQGGLNDAERAKAQRWIESCKSRIEKYDAKIQKFEEDAQD